MSEWMKERICENCGNKFSLKEHGHPGAWAAAEYLEGRIKESRGKKEADFMAVTKCPGCKSEAFVNLFSDMLQKEANKKPLKWWQLWGWWKDDIFVKLEALVYGISFAVVYYLYSMYLSRDSRIFQVLTYVAAFPSCLLLARNFVFKKLLSGSDGKTKPTGEIPALIIGVIFSMLVFAILAAVFGDPNI